MNKCDCCGQFGELEEITVVIKKHKACDINGAFGKQEPRSAFFAPKEEPIQLVPDKVNPAAPYVNDELKKMIL